MIRSRAALLAIACCLMVSRTVCGEEVVRSVRWQELAAANMLTSGTVVAARAGEPAASLRIIHKGGVAAGSYLEMWTHLPDGSFFSRSLAENGPMGRLEGSSDWRVFVLPFFNREGGSPPEKLVFNLVMTGAGTVEMGPLELVQFASDEEPLADSAAWWSNRQAGMLGGIIGSALGILGAVVGWLGSAVRAKGFVLGTLRAMGWFGIGALASGALALAVGQPYAVYYPLLLLGSISAALGFSLPRSLSRRYEDLELRRMQALDA